MVRNNYIKIRDGKVEALLDVLFYVKEKVVYAYAPALDLVGYDYSEDGAKQSLNVGRLLQIWYSEKHIGKRPPGARVSEGDKEEGGI